MVDVKEVESKYPIFWEWHHRLLEREAVEKVMGERLERLYVEKK